MEVTCIFKSRKLWPGE